jgi:hypothetical protein
MCRIEVLMLVGVMKEVESLQCSHVQHAVAKET